MNDDELVEEDPERVLRKAAITLLVLVVLAACVIAFFLWRNRTASREEPEGNQEDIVTLCEATNRLRADIRDYFTIDLPSQVLPELSEKLAALAVVRFADEELTAQCPPA